MFLHLSVSHSVHGGGGILACIAGGIPACLAAGLRGRGWYPSMPSRFPGPHPGGKLRGLARVVSRSTSKGEVEGSGLGGLQAHTQGGVQAHTHTQATTLSWKIST